MAGFEVITEAGVSRERTVSDADLDGGLLGAKSQRDYGSGRDSAGSHQEGRPKRTGLGDGIGWHTFRHSYRSWLDDTGAPLTVQKELMRHASIQTTMNVYGKAMSSTKT